jgi:hypothetical protein
MCTSGSADNERLFQLNLDLIRERRNHYRELYKQQESRAQVVGGVLTVVVAALLNELVGGTSTGLGCLGWILLCLSCASLLLALGLSMLVLLPADGRRLFHSPQIDRMTDHLGYLGRPEKHQLAKIRDAAPDGTAPDPSQLAQRLTTFRERVLVRHVTWFEGKPEDPRQRVLTTELWNTWALWSMLERKAGLLRLGMLVGLGALLLSAVSWVVLETASDGQHEESEISPMVVRVPADRAVVPSPGTVPATFAPVLAPANAQPDQASANAASRAVGSSQGPTAATAREDATILPDPPTDPQPPGESPPEPPPAAPALP